MSDSYIALTGCTDIGLVRSENQDDFLIIDSTDSPVQDFAFLILADGMGGHNGGKIASNLSVNTFKSSLIENAQSVGNKINSLLDKCFAITNSKVIKESKNNLELIGMGSTLTVAAISNHFATIANIGDSRAYLLNEKGIVQVTKDHSWVADQVEAGILSKEEADSHPHKNIITKAIGINVNGSPDIFNIDISPGDYILLCSDGLSNLVTDEEIFHIVKSTNITKACENLIKLAKERGGFDNITIGIASI